MKFSEALVHLEEGLRISRSGWNGKGMWIALYPGEIGMPSHKLVCRHAKSFAVGNGGKADVLPCVMMKTSDSKILFGWLASQSDLTSDDWEVVE